MITQMTSSNRDEYLALFSDALIDLRNDTNMISVESTIASTNY